MCSSLFFMQKILLADAGRIFPLYLKLSISLCRFARNLPAWAPSVCNIAERLRKTDEVCRRNYHRKH